MKTSESNAEAASDGRMFIGACAVCGRQTLAVVTRKGDRPLPEDFRCAYTCGMGDAVRDSNGRLQMF